MERPNWKAARCWLHRQNEFVLCVSLFFHSFWWRKWRFFPLSIFHFKKIQFDSLTRAPCVRVWVSMLRSIRMRAYKSYIALTTEIVCEANKNNTSSPGLVIRMYTNEKNLKRKVRTKFFIWTKVTLFSKYIAFTSIPLRTAFRKFTRISSMILFCSELRLSSVSLNSSSVCAIALILSTAKHADNSRYYRVPNRN